MNLMVEAGGTDYPHDEDYLLDRPGGYGARYVLIFFMTPCMVRDGSGTRRVDEGEAIIYPPGSAQYNRPVEQPFRNHWLHLYGRGCRKLIRSSGLPLNEIFTPGEWGFIAPSIHQMRLELFQDRDFKLELLQRMAEIFLLRLGRSCHERQQALASSADIAHFEALQELRGQVLNRFAEEWTVEKMAGLANLSRSRFCFLYKKFFNISPVNDLIRCRLEQARDMMMRSDLTVEAVAGRCGFASGIHFHRLFKKHFGASPRQLCRSDISSLEALPGRVNPPLQS